MPDEQSSSPERLTAIESTVAHLQHDYDQLHDAVLTLQADVRLLQLTFQKLMERMDRSSEQPEERSPEMERPPHY